MFGSERFEPTGLFGGLMVLVLLGAGLSTLVDFRFDYSKATREASRDHQASAEKLAELWARRSGLQDAWENRTRQAGMRQEDLARLQHARSQHSTRLPALQLQARELASEVERLDKSFVDYRARYRTEQWRNAAGTNVGTLILANGRRYTGVSIVRVTSDGLEIAHDQGRARIPRRELEPAWQERLQWVDTPR